MASQIASLRKAAGVERGFRLWRKPFPRRARVTRHRFYFECLATYLAHPCGCLFFSELLHPVLNVSANAILKIRKISETAKFRFLPSECGVNPVGQGLKFEGQWKRVVWNFHLLSWPRRGTMPEFRRNRRHLTADLGARCPTYSNIWTCISIDVNFVLFLCRGKDVSVWTFLSILTIIGIYIQLDKRLWINSLLRTLRFSYRHKSWLPHK